MKKKVIVKGPALSASGYGEHARFVLRALKKHEETMMKLLVEQEGIQKQIFSILNVKY